MKFIFLLALCFSTFCLKAQTSKELIGKWKLIKFTDPSGKPKSIMDEYKTEDVYQVFDADNKFHGIVGSKEKDGKWSLSKDNKELTVKVSIISIKFKVIYADTAKRTIQSDMLGTLEYEKVN